MLILDTQVSNNEAKISLNASFHTVFLLLDLCDVTEGGSQSDLLKYFAYEGQPIRRRQVNKCDRENYRIKLAAD